MLALRVFGLGRWAARPVSFFGFLAIVAAAYLLIRLARSVRRYALWRLRNRLIVAYVFMAVVPVVLLLTMVTVAAYLLELQIGAHLLRDDLQDRLGILAADTNAIAAALNREPDLGSLKDVPAGLTPSHDPALARPGVADAIAAAQTEWPDIHVRLTRGRDLLAPGSASQTSGLTEYNGHVSFVSTEALAAPGGQATVQVIAPITPELLDSLPSKLGPIQLTLLVPAPQGTAGAIALNLGGVPYIRQAQVASRTRVVAPQTNWFDLRVNGVATLDSWRGRSSGPTAVPGKRPVLAQFSLRLSAVNHDLLTSVGEVGPFLTEILVVIGGIFLLLEIAALVTGVVMTRTITRAVADLYEATSHVRRGDFSHRVRVQQRGLSWGARRIFQQI